MDHAVIDRRSHARVTAARLALRATVRGGSLVSVVDLSAGGVLVQAPRPLRPGARVQVLIVCDGRTHAVFAHVLRCAVWALHPEAGVTYRGALRFEDRCECFWE